MFQKLKDRWEVGAGKLFLIILTFASGGSLCGYLGRKILGLTSLSGFPYLFTYIIAITLLWPACVLAISIPLGQFSFFKKYLRKLILRLNLSSNLSPGNTDRRNLAIFASGAGSNARNIIEYFKGSQVNISVIVCNKPGAGVIEIGRQHQIPVLMVTRDLFYSPNSCLAELAPFEVDWVILAGFLWKIPSVLIEAFPNHMLNIHPALLPKYGGQGMYGKHVHEAVIAAGEKESGISIHYVDDLYDHGEIVEQARCEVNEADTAESLAAKINQLEMKCFPQVIERLVKAKS